MRAAVAIADITEATEQHLSARKESEANAPITKYMRNDVQYLQ